MVSQVKVRGHQPISRDTPISGKYQLCPTSADLLRLLRTPGAPGRPGGAVPVAERLCEPLRGQDHPARGGEGGRTLPV